MGCNQKLRLGSANFLYKVVFNKVVGQEICASLSDNHVSLCNIFLSSTGPKDP
jgi:hypothetical protein